LVLSQDFEASRFGAQQLGKFRRRILFAKDGAAALQHQARRPVDAASTDGLHMGDRSPEPHADTVHLLPVVHVVVRP
jgi:hypothetical protein